MKFLLGQIEIFDFKKLHSDLYFQLQLMYSSETVGKVACKDWGSQNLQYKHHNGKRQTQVGGWVVKDMDFSGVLKK